jgi:RHS repeat-associated protein
LYLSERNIYGSSRLGMENVNYLIASTNAGNIEAYAHENVVVGDKAFELSNHLGNFNDTWVLSNKTLSGINPVRNLSEATGVLNTITDKKLPEFDATTGDLAFFNADVVGYSDYYPFGMQMPGRHDSGGYRFQFNGKEQDPEIAGSGNVYDYGFRIYNPRIAKFLSVAPLTASYPWYTPYQFAGNMPIIAIDLDGLEEFIVVKYTVNGSLVGWGIKQLQPPNASTILLEALKEEKNKMIRKRDGFGRSKEEKKGFKHAIKDCNTAIAELTEAILVEQQKINDENRRIENENFNKAVFLEIDGVGFTSLGDVGNALDKIPASEWVDKPICNLDPGSLKFLEDKQYRENGNIFIGDDGTRKIAGGEFIPFSLRANELFSTGNSQISEKGKTDLLNVAQAMMNNPGMKFSITGHTDNVGNPSLNLQLSIDRANSVANFLKENGVRDSQITRVTGLGDRAPLGDNNTEAGRAQNRRVDIVQQN